MASKSPSPLGLKVTQHKPRLVVPAKSTPRELKHLSDIDDQEIFRHQIPVIMFYKNSPSMEGKDPATAVREALSKALVFYYPFAGRLVEGPNRKLMVDCTGEGVLFREADTDATLDQIGDEMLPACPYLEELLRDVPGSDGILGCPLLLIQVTRFSCGGFTFALRLNHTMCDATGTVQFLDAIAEFSRGIQNAPSVLPVWERELLAARQPPRVTFAHNEYNQMLDTNALSADHDDSSLIHKSFFFGPRAIRALRNHLPPHHPTSYSTFNVLTACLLRSRTRALGLDPNEIVSISCAFNGRGKQHGVLVPQGYYGNVVASPASVSNAGMICTYPLEYAVELIKKAKAQMCEEYLRSVADFMVIKGRPSLNIMPQNCFVSDTRHAGFHKVDFGWGEPVYGGTARVAPSICLVTSYKNRRGEDGIVLALCLPPPAMEKFEQELKKMTEEEDKENPYDRGSQGIVSKL